MLKAIQGLILLLLHPFSGNQRTINSFTTCEIDFDTCISLILHNESYGSQRSFGVPDEEVGRNSPVNP